MYGIPDCTVVTCCYDTSKFNSHALSVIEALKRFNGVLQLPVYLVVYTETCFYNEIVEKRRSYGHEHITVVHNVGIEQLWAFQFLQTVKENRKKYHPSKDLRTSPESHLITLNKFDFVLRSIEENPFSTNKFCWLDAFLTLDTTLIRICENYEPNTLLKILNTQSEKFHIQILNVQDKKYKIPEHKREYYSTYRYVVCGGMFMCGKDIGRRILGRLKDICVETTKMGYGHGEEPMYLEVLDEFYDDIEKGYGDYGQIINNLVKPTKNLRYIFECIINRYLMFGYHRECFDCCKKVLDSIETYNTTCEPHLHMRILFSYYVSAYYYRPTVAPEIISNIYTLCRIHPKIHDAYMQQKHFYEEQFSYCVNRNYCIFTNDNYVQVQLLDHHYSTNFKNRDNHEILFRRINTYLLNNGIIDKTKNIIDLGAWIGDNSIPWAKNIKGMIYAIDPSSENIEFINSTSAINNIKNITTLQYAVSNTNEVLSTNDNIHHCSFVYGNTGVNGIHKLNAISLDYLYENKVIENISYIHLDVEGMEYKILQGCTNILDKYKPIISFEQHLELDDYNLILTFLKNKNYVVFLVDEILPGCRSDCRNSFAFHNSIFTNQLIENINAHIGKDIMVHQL